MNCLYCETPLDVESEICQTCDSFNPFPTCWHCDDKLEQHTKHCPVCGEQITTRQEAKSDIGKKLLEEAEYDEAINVFTELLTGNLNDVDALYHRALSYEGASYGENEYRTAKAIHDFITKAIGDFTQIIDIDPENVKVIYKRAIAHYRLYTLSSGTTSKSSPNEIFGFSNSSLFLEEALKDATLVLGMFPTHLDALILRSTIYLSQGLENKPMAALDLTSAIRIAPTNLTLLERRARLYLDMHQYEKSIKDFTKIHDKIYDPDFHFDNNSSPKNTYSSTQSIKESLEHLHNLLNQNESENP